MGQILACSAGRGRIGKMNKKFYLQGKDLKDEMVNRWNNVWFYWNITYTCNFRCPYCFFDGKWEEYGPRTKFLSVSEWIRYWRRIYNLYGEAFLVITGGEPFTYPDFIELMASLAQMHRINISTNGSGNLERFVKTVDPKKVSLTLAYHPEFSRLEDTIAKVRMIRKKGFKVDYINICAYPPYIKSLDKYFSVIEEFGIRFKVIPFFGEYKGKKYPGSYNRQERKTLGMDNQWEENVKRKGTLCCAGYRTALIFPDGKVARCGQIGEKYLLSNFFSKNFTLLDKPYPCEAKWCPCLEAPGVGQ